MKPIYKNPISISTAMVAMALSACGGGGSGAPADTGIGNNGGTSTTATVSRLTGVNGFKVNYTPNIDAAIGWVISNTSPVTYTSSDNINSFEVTDSATPAHTFSQISANGISAGHFALLGQTNLGGTTYKYSRFGWLAGYDTETNGSTSTWYAPFALASTTPTSPSDLSYAGTQQASVYLAADRNITLSGVSGYATCDTSANYTANNKTLKLTLSNCNTAVGFNISGDLSLSNGTGTTTITAQESQRGAANQTVTSTNVESGNFMLAGPNGEELVGAATIRGSIALTNGTGGSNPAIFLVIFGGKKQ